MPVGPRRPSVNLLAEQRGGAVGPGSRRAARLRQEQQRQEAGRLRVVGDERREDSRQQDRLQAETRLGRAVQPCGVDQVDDGQHGAQAVGQLVTLRHAVGDSRGLDLALGADETYRHRRLGHQEASRDLPGRQAAEQPRVSATCASVESAGWQHVFACMPMVLR
jgi:hypothetical protein